MTRFAAWLVALMLVGVGCSDKRSKPEPKPHKRVVKRSTNTPPPPPPSADQLRRAHLARLVLRTKDLAGQQAELVAYLRRLTTVRSRRNVYARLMRYRAARARHLGTIEQLTGGRPTTKALHVELGAINRDVRAAAALYKTVLLSPPLVSEPVAKAADKSTRAKRAAAVAALSKLIAAEADLAKAIARLSRNSRAAFDQPKR